MFELNPAVPAPAAPWFAALPGPTGFAADPRFQPAPAHATPPGDPVANDAQAHADECAAAHARGVEAGRAQAQREADGEQAERRRLGSAIRRFDEDMTQRLGAQLAATVAALCDATLAPAAHDAELLMRRCTRAAALLAETRDACTLYLNPADIPRLDADFTADWRIAPDPALPPGGLRIEGREGGIADGPDEWRRALAEALAAC